MPRIRLTLKNYIPNNPPAENNNNQVFVTGQQSAEPRYIPIAPSSIPPPESNTEVRYTPIAPLSVPPTDNDTGKQKRTPRACDLCRTKKIKCHLTGSSNCRKCTRIGKQCTFDFEVRKRGPRTQHIVALDDRLKRLERLWTGTSTETTGTSRMERLEKLWNVTTTGTSILSKPESTRKSVNRTSEETNNLPVDQSDSPMNIAAPEDISEIPVLHDSNNGRGDGSTTSNAKTKHTQHYHLDPTKVFSESSYDCRYLRENNLLRVLLEGTNGPQIRRELSSRYGLCVQYNENSNFYCFKKITNNEDERINQINELREVGIISPHETIKDVNEWIYRVSGIDKILSNRLLKIYFSYIHPLLPVINKTEFLQEYRGIRPVYPAACLLNAIYGAAVRYVENCRKFNDLDSLDDGGAWDFPESFSEQLYDNIMNYIKAKYVPRVSTIQALIIAHNHSANVDNWTFAWLLNCTAVRMCQELGLHRAVNGWNISEQEKETRKIVWWSAYVLDRWFAAGSGRPLTIFDEDCDAEYPSVNMNVDEVLDTMTENDQHLPRFPSVTEAVNNGDKIPLNEPFIQLLKLSEILGFVLQNLYTAKAKKHSAQYGSDSTVAYVNEALSKWRAALPPLFEISKAGETTVQNKDHNPLASVSGLICLSYCTLLILLHRPFIENSGDSEKSKESSQKSLEICTSAAIRIIEVAESMHYRDFLLISWGFALYPVFTAALIHTYNCSNPISIVSEAAKANLMRSFTVLKKLSILSPIAVDMGLVLKRVITESPIFVNDSEFVARVTAGDCTGRYTVVNDETFKRKYATTTESSSGDNKPPEEKRTNIHQSSKDQTNQAATNQVESTEELTPTDVAGLLTTYLMGMCKDDTSKQQNIALELKSQPPSDVVLQQPVMHQGAPTTNPDNLHQLQNFYDPSTVTASNTTFLNNSTNINNNSYNALLSSAPIDQIKYPGTSLAYDVLNPYPLNMLGLEANMPTSTFVPYNTPQFPWDVNNSQQDPSAIFRHSPGNPFWSIPTSMELDEWTAYLLPHQSQKQHQS